MINPKLNLDADGAVAPLIYADSKEKNCVFQREHLHLTQVQVSASISSYLKSLTHLKTLNSGWVML